MAASGRIALQSGVFLPVGGLAGNLERVRGSVSAGSPVRVLLRFSTVPGAEERRALAEAGAALFQSLGNGVFFAEIAPGADEVLLEGAGVTWLGAIYPEDKLPSRIVEEGPGHWAWREGQGFEMAVRCFPEVSPGEWEAAAARCGATVLEVSARRSQVRMVIAADRLLDLAAEPVVRWIEEAPPPPVALNDGVRTNIQAEVVQAAPYGLSGANVVVAICDEGEVDEAHDDLKRRVTLLTTSFRNAHATHVAGTLAGTGVRSAAEGGTELQWRGMAPAAKLLSFDFDDPLNPLEEAVGQRGAVVAHNSWGMVMADNEFVHTCDLFGKYTSYAPDYDQFVVGDYGRPISVVFAAGNSRPTNSCGVGPYGTVGPPATAKNVLSVGAINSDDNAVAIFSAWGPTADGRLKPELVAPGDEVGGDAGVRSCATNNTYALMQGTSMAAPAVSGAVALLVEDYRNHFDGLDPYPSVVRALLVHTAEDLGEATPDCHAGPDFASGYGRVQVQSAVDQLRGRGFLVGAVGHGVTNSYVCSVPSGATMVRLTLAWDDPAAAENAAATLVNDLDLVVIDPLGVRHYPWTLDPANPSAPAVRTAEDHRNVLEQVQVEGAVPEGAWTVQVVGGYVATGASQRYALAFTPAGIPMAAELDLERVAYSDAGIDAANGNGTIDPGETFHLETVLHNLYGPFVTNLVAQLSTTNEGVTVLTTGIEFGSVASGLAITNPVPWECKVAKTVACGEQVLFALTTGADGLTATKWFTVPVGLYTVTNVVTNVWESADVPHLIPYAPSGAGVVSTNTVTDFGEVVDVDVAIRVEHTAHGDVELRLEHPDGTKVFLVEPSGTGGADFGTGDCETGVRTVFDDEAAEEILDAAAPCAGSYRPVAPLSAMDGKPVGGVWQLRARDGFDDLDVGTNHCWSLRLVYQQYGYVCSLFDRAPVAESTNVAVIFNAATNLVLSATDADEDPLVFEIRDLPTHGVLSGFDAGSGAVVYTPDVGYVGPDQFTFAVSDGYEEALGTVTLEVQAATAEVGLVVEAPVGPQGLGSLLACRVLVTNLGPNAATSVLWTNLLAAGLQVVAAVPTVGACTEEPGLLRWEVGDLDPLAGAALELTLQPEAVGYLTNQAVATAVEIDPAPENNAVEWTIDVRPQADLAVSVPAGSGLAMLGQRWDWEIAVTNLGPSLATGIEVRQAVPAALADLTGEATAGGWVHEGGWLVWSIPSLDAGGSILLQMSARADLLGSLTNLVTVVAFEFDPDSANNGIEVPLEITPASDLLLSGLAGGSLLLEQEVTWEVGVTNVGPSPSTAASALISLPASFAIEEVAVDIGSWSTNLGSLQWDLGGLEVGGGGLMVLRVRPQAVGPAIVVSGVTGPEPDPVGTNNGGETVWEVVPTADLALSGAGPGSVALGQKGVFSVTLSNGGPSTATGVQVTADVPEGLTLLGATSETGTVTVTQNQVLWQVEELVVGPGVTLSLTAEGAIVGTWTNQMQVVAPEADPNQENSRLLMPVEVRQLADLALGGTADPETAFIEQGIAMELLLTNLGPNNVEGAEVTQEYPPALAIMGVEVSSGSWSVGDASVSWQPGALAAGAVAWLRYTATPSVEGSWVLPATATAPVLDPDLANNRKVLTINSLPAANLRLSATGGGKFPLYQETTNTWWLTNAGPSTAHGVTVSGTIPAGLALLRLSATSGLTGVEGADVRWEIPSLEAGTAVALEIAVRTEALGIWVSDFAATATEGDPDPADNVASVTVEARGLGDVALSMQAVPDGAAAGGELVFAIQVNNLGAEIAHNLEVANWLPAGFQHVSSIVSTGSVVSPDQPLRWQIAEIGIGEAATWELRARTGAEGYHTNMATVTLDEIDQDPANNSASAVVEVTPAADLAVGAADETNHFWGQLRTYPVLVTNAGPSEALDVQVTLQFGEGVHLEAATSSLGVWTLEGAVANWTLDRLAAGAVETLELQLAGDTIGSWTNRAEISGSLRDLVATNNVIEWVSQVVPIADLGVDAQGQAIARIGVPFVWEITITNRGPSDADGVVISQSLDAALSVAESTPSQGSVGIDGGQLRWEAGSVAAGGAASLQLTLQASAAGIIQQVTGVQGAEADPELGDNTKLWSIDVRPDADLALGVVATPSALLCACARAASAGVVATPSALLLGAEGGLTVSVTNLGPADATEIRVDCQFDAGLTRYVVEPGDGLWVDGEAGRGAWHLSSLAAGEDRSFLVRLAGVQEGAAANSFGVVAWEIDPEVGNNAAETVVSILPAADLQLGLTGDVTMPIGRETEVSVVVSNAGPSRSTAVVVRAELPAGWSVVRADDLTTNWVVDAGVLRWDVGDLEIGSGATSRWTVRGESEADPVPENHVAVMVMEVRPVADLAVWTSEGMRILLGSTAVIDLGVTNSGPSDATGLRVTNILAGGLQFVEAGPASGSVAADQGVLVWDLDFLAAGAVSVLPITVRGDLSGLWTNVASVQAAEEDLDPDNNLARGTVAVREEANVGVRVDADSTDWWTGDVWTVRVAVTNRGPAAARAVRVQSMLTGPVAVLETFPSDGVVTREGGLVQWDLPELPALGEALLQVQVVAATDGGVTNHAVIAADEIDPDPADDEAVWVGQIRPRVDLAVWAEPVGTVPWLQTSQLTLWLSNAGPSTATGILVSHAAAEGLTWTSGVADRGEWTAEDGGGRWTMDQLAAGEAARLELGLVGDLIGAWTNLFVATVVETDLTPEDNASAPVVEVVPAADLGVTLLGPESLILGRVGTWTVRATNAGPSEASQVVVAVPLAQGFRVGPAGTPSIGTVTAQIGLVRWEIPGFGVGASGELQFEMLADEPGRWTNTAVAAGAEWDAYSENDQSSAVTQVAADADLRVGIEVPKEPQFVGLGFIFHVTLTNVGPNTALGMVVTHELAPDLTLVSAATAQGAWSREGQRIVWSVDQLPVGEEARIEFIVRADAEGTPGCAVALTSETIDLNPVDNVAAIEFQVLPLARFHVAVAASKDPVWALDWMDYTITVTNESVYDLPGVRILDTLPAGVEVLQVVASQGEAVDNGTLVTCDLGTLPVGGSAQAVVTVRPGEPGWLTNRVEAASDYEADSASRLRAEIVTEVAAQPLLTVEQNGARFTVSWPLAATDYRLEYADQPGPPAVWRLDMNTPELASTNGPWFVSPKVLTWTNRFYRLRQVSP